MAGMNTCGVCGQGYKASAGHCTGGRFGGCCSSFGTQSGFDRHRVGEHDDGSRRCLSEAERTEQGWVLKDGYWRSAADEKSAQAVRAHYGEQRSRGLELGTGTAPTGAGRAWE